MAGSFIAPGGAYNMVSPALYAVSDEASFDMVFTLYQSFKLW
jgi:hypothetical protein